jgi:hypothetical protein
MRHSHSSVAVIPRPSVRDAPTISSAAVGVTGSERILSIAARFEVLTLNPAALSV